MKTLTEMLTEREAIAQLCETILDEGTEHWGVKVNIIIVIKFIYIINNYYCYYLGGACRSQRYSSTTTINSCYGS